MIVLARIKQKDFKVATQAFLVDYKDLNGVEIKSIRHPNGVDAWNEVDACTEIRNAGNPNTAVNVTLNEIEWWKKYAGQNLTVTDAYIGIDISVNAYITELKSYI